MIFLRNLLPLTIEWISTYLTWSILWFRETTEPCNLLLYNGGLTNRIDCNYLTIHSTLMQLSSRQYHALPTHCHPCNVSQFHWAGKRKFGELSPIGDTDAPIEFSHQFRQNRQNSTRQNPTLGWKITTRPEWVGNFLHARGFECGTRALHYYHWNSSEMLTT